MELEEFGLSTFDQIILISEGPLSPIRAAFIILTITIGLISGCYVMYHFYFLIRRPTKWKGKGIWPVLLLFVVYLCHLIIHTIHFADNIARPVDYFEPKWLYQCYILSTMEIPFFLNIPITFYGAISMIQFLSGYFLDGDSLLHVYLDNPMETTTNSMKLRQIRDKMILYSSMSILTLMHYVVEPPQSYTLPVNFTIAGEGISALILVIAITRFSRLCLIHAEQQAIEFSRLVVRSHQVHDIDIHTKGYSYVERAPTFETTNSRIDQISIRSRTPLRRQTH